MEDYRMRWRTERDSSQICKELLTKAMDQMEERRLNRLELQARPAISKELLNNLAFLISPSLDTRQAYLKKVVMTEPDTSKSISSIKVGRIPKENIPSHQQYCEIKKIRKNTKRLTYRPQITQNGRLVTLKDPMVEEDRQIDEMRQKKKIIDDAIHLFEEKFLQNIFQETIKTCDAGKGTTFTTDFKGKVIQFRENSRKRDYLLAPTVRINTEVDQVLKVARESIGLPNQHDSQSPTESRVSKVTCIPQLRKSSLNRSMSINQCPK